MEERTNLPNELIHFMPWNASVHPLWLGSSLCLRRNLSLYPFPSKLSTKEMQKIQNLIKESLKKIFLKGAFYPLEKLTPIERQALLETFPNLTIHNGLSEGQALIIDETGKRIISINGQDHVILMLQDLDAHWENSFQTLMDLEDQISLLLPFAFDDRFGYLTSSPLHAGTGFEAYFYLHLPCLLRKGLHELPDSITYMSLEGTLESFLGDIVVLKNAYCLGISESILLKNLFSQAMKLILAEEEERKMQKKKPSEEIKDLVSRAVGLLLHSYQLSTKETIDALSLLKLGIDLGFIRDISHQKLNELFFLCQRGHLSLTKKVQDVDEKTIAHDRASLLHQELKGLMLNS